MQAEGLTKLVEHNNKKVAEKQLEGLKTELAEMISQDPPTPVDECLAAVKAKKAEFALADSELVKVRSASQLNNATGTEAASVLLCKCACVQSEVSPWFPVPVDMQLNAGIIAGALAYTSHTRLLHCI